MLRIFALVKIQRLRPGLNPRTRENNEVTIVIMSVPLAIDIFVGSARFEEIDKVQFELHVK
jgi:hypothetical protein